MTKILINTSKHPKQKIPTQNTNTTNNDNHSALKVETENGKFSFFLFLLEENFSFYIDYR